jgi:ribonuclease D
MPASESHPPLAVIDRPAELRALVRRLASEPRVALDTEAASFHRFVDRVYLVQLSSDTETALVDPLSVADLAPIGELLANPEVEVVLHDADYDLRILDRDYGFRARNIFDTRVAAQLAGEPAVGLGSLLEKYFGVQVDKKFQRADWSRRPLTTEMIEYAADDTRYLTSLRDTLEQKLREIERLEWVREEFRLLEDLRWTQPSGDNEDAYLRIKGARALKPKELAILRELHRWRERTARSLDRARFRVLSNSALLAVAKAAPTSAKKLAAVQGMPVSTAQRYGDPVLRAVKKGLAVPADKLPRVRRSRRPEPDPEYDQRLERLKQLRNHRAEAVGLAPGLVCPNGTLQEVARAGPHSTAELDGVDELRHWQREVVGDSAILAAVEGAGGQKPK